MKKRKIIGIHFIVFIVISIAFFFSSEVLLNCFAKGIHTVEMWITVLTYGITFISILIIISCSIFLMRSKNLNE